MDRQPAGGSRSEPQSLVAELRLLLETGRVVECTMMLGMPFLCGLLLVFDPARADLARTLLLGAAFYALILHIYLFNAWGGAGDDALDPNKRDLPLVTGAIAPRRVWRASLACLVAATALFALLTPPLAALCLLTAGMWATYAHPRIRWKSVSALPTAIHVTGGVLTALLVQGAFAPLDARGAAVGLYFGLVLAAGHLTHEVLDRDADAKAGFATSAIRFGPRRVLAASFATMTASTAWFALLTARGVVPAVALAGPLLIFVPYLAEFVRARRAPASHEAVLRFRARYRVLYAVSSMWIAAAVILSRH